MDKTKGLRPETKAKLRELAAQMTPETKQVVRKLLQIRIDKEKAKLAKRQSDNAALSREQEYRLFSIVTQLLTAGMRLGHIRFKANAKYILKTIRERFGNEVADRVTLNHLQGSYISLASQYNGTDNKMTVIAVESLDEIIPKKPKLSLVVSNTTKKGGA